MSKFLPQKKKLIEDVFEKASNEATEKSFSGILKSLELALWEDFKIKLSYKTFESYYNSMIVNDGDYNIKPLILDDLSIYLGYNNFKEYCSEWKTVEHSIKESISNVVINIINKPLLKMPEFLMKQSGMGILGALLIGGIFVGKKFVTREERMPEVSNSKKVVGIMDYSAMKNDSAIYYKSEIEKAKIPTTQIIRVVENSIQSPIERLQHYMYWNGERFVATAEASLGSQFEVVPMDEFKFKYFRKITQPDTITTWSVKKVWYSKKDNVVEFFTADGRNPDNDAELKQLSNHILNKYILSSN